MKFAWVVGGGGLLGQALVRFLRKNGAEVFVPPERLRWGDSSIVETQLRTFIESFACCISASDEWEIYWAAGVGTMNSKPDSLAVETEALGNFLRLLSGQSRLFRVGGSLGFASSAGAIYAAALDELITENSMAAPTTPYAYAKLEQEELIRTFTLSNRSVRTLIARISTLYGAGQSPEKQQGLLTHIARSILTQKAIQIYVPFDTIRDYINADDAASAFVHAVRASAVEGGVVIKIIASEKPTTIAEIISVFKRVSRRKPRVVTSASKLGAVYSRRVQYRSLVLRPEIAGPSTSLLVGIALLFNAERENFVRPRRAQAGRTPIDHV